MTKITTNTKQSSSKTAKKSVNNKSTTKVSALKDPKVSVIKEGLGELKSPSMTQVNGYAFSVGSKVDSGKLLVHTNAQALHDSICENYNKINAYFQVIGEEFIEATNYVSGTNFQNNLKKVGTSCKKQSNSCLSRKKDLIENFQYQPLEQRVNDLEKKVTELIEKLNSKNTI